MTEESESASGKSKEINVYTHKENLYTSETTNKNGTNFLGKVANVLLLHWNMI